MSVRIFVAIRLWCASRNVVSVILTGFEFKQVNFRLLWILENENLEKLY